MGCAVAGSGGQHDWGTHRGEAVGRQAMVLVRKSRLGIPRLGPCLADLTGLWIGVLGGIARTSYRPDVARSGAGGNDHLVPDLRRDDTLILPARVFLRQRGAVHRGGYLAVLDRPSVGGGLSGTVRDGDGGHAVL